MEFTSTTGSPNGSMSVPVIDVQSIKNFMGTIFTTPVVRNTGNKNLLWKEIHTLFQTHFLLTQLVDSDSYYLPDYRPRTYAEASQYRRQPL